MSTTLIRQLEWQERYCRPDCEEEEVTGWAAVSGFGTPYRVEIDDFNVKGWQLSYGAVMGNFDTPDAAKAAAQADFERRALSVLTDALLITAAPDMLVALKQADRELTVRLRTGLTTDAEMSAQQASDLVDTNPAIILIRAAIAKASA